MKNVPSLFAEDCKVWVRKNGTSQSRVEHGSRHGEKGPGVGEGPSFWDKANLNCGRLPESRAYSLRASVCPRGVWRQSRFHQNPAFRFTQNKTQQAIKLPTPVEKAPRIYGPRIPHSLIILVFT